MSNPKNNFKNLYFLDGLKLPSRVMLCYLLPFHPTNRWRLHPGPGDSSGGLPDGPTQLQGVCQGCQRWSSDFGSSLLDTQQRHQGRWVFPYLDSSGVPFNARQVQAQLREVQGAFRCGWQLPLWGHAHQSTLLHWEGRRPFRDDHGRKRDGNAHSPSAHRRDGRRQYIEHAPTRRRYGTGPVRAHPGGRLPSALPS